MKSQTQLPLPGTYMYVYPTFSDSPQRICIHAFDADKAYAFVSYPGHPNHKAPQALKVSWFKTVILQQVKEYPKVYREVLCLN
ncbi:hypothetical protein [Spirosoma koreense]